MNGEKLLNLKSVLTRPEQVKAAFFDSDKHSKAVNNNSGYYMQKLLGRCVGLVGGEKWKTLKTVMEVPFLHPKMDSYVELVDRHVSKHLEKLSVSMGEVDPSEDFKMLPFSIVTEIIYGELPAELEDQLRKLIPLREDLFKTVIAGGLTRFAFSKYLPLYANRQLENFKTNWEDFNRATYCHAQSNNLSIPLVDMYSGIDGIRITEEDVLQTLDEMLFANLDVTMGGISWSIVQLAAHRDTGLRLLDEVEKNRLGGNEAFNKYLLSSSSFLQACILESARLRPLAAFSVPQSAPTDRIIDGYLIPAGTNLIIDSNALNIHNDFWGMPNERVKFRPERFLEKGRMEFRYCYWRFGFGPRQCMGKYIADLIMRILLVHLVENFELGMLGERTEEWDRMEEKWIDHPKLKIKCIRK